jgi:hypothetical protein
MKNYGLGLLIIGAAMSVSALLFINTALPGTEVINIGRVQLQQLLFQGGSALFLAGAVFVAGDHVGQSLAKPAVLEGQRVTVPIVGISVAIAGSIAVLMFAFGSGDRSRAYDAAGEPVAAAVANNASALADQMEAEADRLEAQR